MMKVLCLGQAAYDITLPIDHYPVENKKVRIPSRVECGGGSSSNCAYLLSKWGLNTYFAGVVGSDYYGSKIKEEFMQGNVNTKYLQTSDEYGTTASYIIANTTVGSRTILTNRDPNIKMFPTEIKEKFDFLLFDGYEKDIALQLINDNPDSIKILDAGSMKEATVELGHLVDYLVCSKDFAEEFTGMKVDYENISSLITIYNTLKKEFQNKIVITLESKGCFTYDNGYKLVPSIPMKAVDSTGAGDIYHGAFMYCIAKNYDLVKTMIISNIAGALSVTKIGGRYSIPSLEEVMDKYNELAL